MTEDQLQTQVAEYLGRTLPEPPMCFWFHCPNGGKRSAATGARLKTMGVKRGVSDILILVRGRLHAIELKVGKNQTSDKQDEFLDAVSENDGQTAVCRSLDEVKGTLRAWGLVRAET